MKVELRKKSLSLESASGGREGGNEGDKCGGARGEAGGLGRGEEGESSIRVAGAGECSDEVVGESSVRLGGGREEVMEDAMDKGGIRGEVGRE